MGSPNNPYFRKTVNLIQHLSFNSMFDQGCRLPEAVLQQYKLLTCKKRIYLLPLLLCLQMQIFIFFLNPEQKRCSWRRHCFYIITDRASKLKENTGVLSKQKRPRGKIYSNILCYQQFFTVRLKCAAKYPHRGWIFVLK